MKSVDSNYGNYSDHVAAKRHAIKAKKFRYLVFESHGGNRGVIGGSSTLEIRGTNSIKELTKPSVLGSGAVFFDTRAGKELNREQLAYQYLNSLTKEQREALLNSVLAAFVLGG